MPQGTQEEMMTPGTNEKYSLAGALHLATGKILYCLGPRKNNGLFRAFLTLLDAAYPARQLTRISVVVDNYCMHKAKAGEQWLARHPRFALLWLPTYCRVPTRLSGCSAIGTTSVHGIINGNASVTWGRTSSGMCKQMGHGRLSSPSSMRHLKSQQQSST
jgi:hypothetical protein